MRRALSYALLCIAPIVLAILIIPTAAAALGHLEEVSSREDVPRMDRRLSQPA